jgi:hypothetical protein
MYTLSTPKMLLCTKLLQYLETCQNKYLHFTPLLCSFESRLDFDDYSDLELTPPVHPQVD